MERLAAPLALLLLGVVAGPAGAGEPAAPPAKAATVSLESIEIRPASPPPDTLCQLRVKLKNSGTREAAAFVFTVKINGAPLPVYRRQVYLEPAAPGATTELRLFNFWTTETGRPLPKDGLLRLEVRVDEALWMERKVEAGQEIWTPGEKVAGLPSARSLTVPLKAAVKPAAKPGR